MGETMIDLFGLLIAMSPVWYQEEQSTSESQSTINMWNETYMPNKTLIHFSKPLFDNKR